MARLKLSPEEYGKLMLERAKVAIGHIVKRIEDENVADEVKDDLAKEFLNYATKTGIAAMDTATKLELEKVKTSQAIRLLKAKGNPNPKQAPVEGDKGRVVPFSNTAEQ